MVEAADAAMGLDTGDTRGAQFHGTRHRRILLDPKVAPHRSHESLGYSVQCTISRLECLIANQAARLPAPGRNVNDSQRNGILANHTGSTSSRAKA